MEDTKTVYLSHWELGLFPGYECYAYSEYDKSGIPLFAEIRKIKKISTWKEDQQRIYNQYLHYLWNQEMIGQLSKWEWNQIDDANIFHSEMINLREMNS